MNNLDVKATFVAIKFSFNNFCYFIFKCHTLALQNFNIAIPV